MLAHAGINSWQVRVLGALKNCRTADMGGHVDACTDCGIVRISSNCPKCQGKNWESWIAAREAGYNTLFEAAWGTINTFSNNPKNLGAAPGMISILAVKPLSAFALYCSRWRAFQTKKMENSKKQGKILVFR